jgi:hypothetical protein
MLSQTVNCDPLEGECDLVVRWGISSSQGILIVKLLTFLPSPYSLIKACKKVKGKVNLPAVTSDGGP